MALAFWDLKALWLKAMEEPIAIHSSTLFRLPLRSQKNNVLENIQKQLELEIPLDISSSENI